MARWQEKGASVREHTVQGPAARTFVTTGRDASDEIALAATWCRDLLAEYPSRRLLVIVPDLAQRRFEVAQIFAQSLAPRAVMGQAIAEESAPFAIEGGQPLSAYPLVRHALTSLRFLCGKLDFTAWSVWLRSAFWSAPSPAARARLEAYLRRGLDIELGVPELLTALQAAPKDLEFAVAPIRNAVESAAHEIEQTPGTADALQWSRRFSAALRALGWPGGRPLSSAEQQTFARFQEVLAELATVTSSLGSMRAIDAVSMLADLAGRTSFEPATGDPAVTLSSALSDPIVRYDGIWVAGLHSDAWPRPPAVDPFIPLIAQRQAGISAVNPTRLLEQARATLRIWQHSATHLALSWPHRDGDREYLASPLLSEVPNAEHVSFHVPDASHAPVSGSPALKRPGKSAAAASGKRVPQTTVSRLRDLPGQASFAFEDSTPGMAEHFDPVEAPREQTFERLPSLAQQLRATRRVESYEDAMGVPWPTSVPVPAGTRTIEYQNRCPVLAYAELRLSCAPLETPRPGVDFRERGTLLHRALELLWTRLGGSQELHAARGPHLDTMVEESVSRAMTDAFGSGGVYQQSRALMREHRRAVRLIRELCELEFQRPPFRIRALEARRTWSSDAGCSLDLRIDRIDVLEDGTHVIFDYKSGMPQSQDWLSERITNPQLLVYMLAVGEPVTALATIQLNSARIGFRGIADRKGRLPRVNGIDPSGDNATQLWRAQQVQWRRSVEQLAADFLAGAAALNPMENACRICHLHAFCRIGDAAAQEADADE